MLCPVCGSSDNLCGCLLPGPPDQDKPEAASPVATSLPGTATGEPAQVTSGEPEGPGASPGRAGPETPGATEWAGDLLDFLRDFASAAPHAAPAVPAEQLGRNRPVARASVDLDLGEHGPLATAGKAMDHANPLIDPTAPGGQDAFSAPDGAMTGAPGCEPPPPNTEAGGADGPFQDDEAGAVPSAAHLSWDVLNLRQEGGRSS
jgi:hypothetical protein